MGLHNVWIATASDGLVRGDQVVGVAWHETPRISGKSSHWLLIVNVAVPAGSGTPAGWEVSILNRTLSQTAEPQPNAPAELAQLLARLDAAGAAGIITPAVSHEGRDTPIHFVFAPFPGTGTIPAPTAPAAIGRDDEYL